MLKQVQHDGFCTFLKQKELHLKAVRDDGVGDFAVNKTLHAQSNKLKRDHRIFGGHLTKICPDQVAFPYSNL